MDIAACGTLYSTGCTIVDYGTLTAPDYLADLVHFFSQGTMEKGTLVYIGVLWASGALKI